MKAPVLIGVLCLASGNALGRDVGNCDAARPVVERYIALDLQGEGTRASKKMAQLIDYQDRDTAGWDSFTLTSESRIKDCRESGGQVVISTNDLRALGAVVEHVVCAIDRSPDGGAALTAAGLQMHALLTRAELDAAEARRPG